MDDEKLKKLLLPYKNLNKNALYFYNNSAHLLTPEFKKTVAPLLTPAFKKQIAAAINAHPLRRTSRAKKQIGLLIKKTRQHPMPVFLLTVYETLVRETPSKKITSKCVRREIEVNSENYLNEYFLDVKIEADYFELLTSKKQKTTIKPLKWSSLSSTLTKVRKKFNAKD